MSEKQQPVHSTELVEERVDKWYRTRRCACGDCRFYSEQERSKCPAMEADRTLVGEWLWTMNHEFLGEKDYIDPLDFAPPQAYTEKKKVNEEKVDEEKEE